MVDFSFISARFLCTDDADEVFAPPSEHHPIYLCIDPTKRDQANLPVVFPIVDPLQNLIGKDFGSGQKRDAMFGKVGCGFLFVPLELVPHITPLDSIIHKCVHAS
jgi:hypothetical protein